MNLRRRTFLGLAGLAALALARVPRFGGAAEVAPKARRPRWGMVVDLQKFQRAPDPTGIVGACVRAHNVPRIDDPAHEVAWIRTASFHAVFADQCPPYADHALGQLDVPVLCNHCENPPCARVCPVGATWKRDDGIVMMDYHRCIGCRYCMAACPYGARSFNWIDPRPYIRQVNADYPTRTRGVVEKCDFCAERLAKGLRPACVEARGDSALVFGDLADPDSEVRRLLRTRYALRRRPELGTEPSVYYLV